MLALVIVALLVLGIEGPAGAHGGRGAERPPASDYLTEIVSMLPPVDGLSVSVVDAGSRLELRNTSFREVVVFGYDGDPNLRVGPDGVFENSHSAAVFLNAERFGRTSIPITANGDADPVWRRMSLERAVRLHDHRAHWMSDTPPAAVLADPNPSSQRISEWTVPVLIDGDEVTVSGTLGWVVPRVGAVTVPVMLWSLLAAGTVLLHRNRVDALLLIGVASAGLAGVFGFVDLGWWSSAVLPTALPEAVARATVALAVGVGVGLVVHAAVVAGQALVERAALRRAEAEAARTKDPAHADTVGAVRRYRWLLVVPILAIAVGVGVLSSSDDRSAVVAPTLAAELCQATNGRVPAVHDELHVQLHQPVNAVAEVDPGAAQGLSDAVDDAAAGEPGVSSTEEVRARADAALVAAGQDRLDCDRS